MGKPKPLNMPSCILLSPESMMKLDGMSMRSLYIEIGQESFFKGMERFQQKKPKKIPTRLLQSMKRIFDGMPDSEIRTLFLSALDGDTDAGQKIEKLGSWGTYRLAFPASSDDGIAMWVDHFVEVESASIEVDALLREAAFVRASDAIKSNPVLRPYFSDAFLQRLATATTEGEALIPRCAGMFEFLLAQVARIEIRLQNKEVPRNVQSEFGCLLVIPIKEATCNPGRELLRWIRPVLKAKTIDELLKMGRKGEIPVINESTLKRWISGKEFPRAEKMQIFIETILKNRDSADTASTLIRVKNQYGAARRLHKLLEMIRSIVKLEKDYPSDKNKLSLLMGCDSADQWIQQRYAFWHKHWQTTDAYRPIKIVN